MTPVDVQTKSEGIGGGRQAPTKAGAYKGRRLQRQAPTKAGSYKGRCLQGPAPTKAGAYKGARQARRPKCRNVSMEIVSKKPGFILNTKIRTVFS